MNLGWLKFIVSVFVFTFNLCATDSCILHIFISFRFLKLKEVHIIKMVSEIFIYLGTQFGGDLSISQAAKYLVGVGLCFSNFDIFIFQIFFLLINECFSMREFNFQIPIHFISFTYFPIDLVDPLLFSLQLFD